MASRTRRAKQVPKKHIVAFVVVGILVCLTIVIGATLKSTYDLIQSWLVDLPEVSSISSVNNASKTKVYASDGTTLLAEFYLENREPVTYDQISQYVLDGTVATEDERFYEHNGVDVKGIARAVAVGLTGGSLEGASTITQQLVRNTLLLDDMSTISLERKVREAELAVEVEKEYSKSEILTMYLNTINYGSGCYGIQAAAQHYFSKDANDLTIAEAALLVGIPQSPTANNPVNNPDNALSRRNTVLDRMLTNGYITQEEHDSAYAEPITLNIAADDPYDGIYEQPYFASYVRSTLTSEYSTDEVFNGGLTVITSLDLTAQSEAESAVNSELEKWDSDIEISLCSIDPSNGKILSMVGGKDYYSDQFNLATQASRQAGSTFKVFTLVAGIEDGYSPNLIVNANSPQTFSINGENWKVSNNDNESWGYISLKRAAQVSANTAYARLIEAVGSDKVVDVANRMGITSTLESVPSITLGTQGVNTLQMSSAFATLASGGIYYKPTAISKIYDSNGNVIYNADTDNQGTRVLSEEVAYAANQVLESVISEGTASDAILASGQQCAGKTGTTQNNRDAMFVGYTPQISTAVWLGAREERYIEGATGSVLCKMWNTYTSAYLKGSSLVKFQTASSPEYDSSLTLLDSSDNYSSSSSSGNSNNENTQQNTTTNNNSNSGNSNGANAGSGESDTGTSTPDTGNTGDGGSGTDSGGGGSESGSTTGGGT